MLKIDELELQQVSSYLVDYLTEERDNEARNHLKVKSLKEIWRFGLGAWASVNEDIDEMIQEKKISSFSFHLLISDVESIVSFLIFYLGEEYAKYHCGVNGNILYSGSSTKTVLVSGLRKWITRHNRSLRFRTEVRKIRLEQKRKESAA